MRLRDYKPGMYEGMSYEDASRMALGLTKMAAVSGETVELCRHLLALSKVMGHTVIHA